MTHINIDPNSSTDTIILKWILYLLFIGKPSNYTFKKIFHVYQADKEITPSHTGSIIGIMERILIVTFLAVHQYSAIGFVFTAKSITRFDRITKDSKFAEYYLIGTLYSVIVAIIPYLLLFEVSPLIN